MVESLGDEWIPDLLLTPVEDMLLDRLIKSCLYFSAVDAFIAAIFLWLLRGDGDLITDGQPPKRFFSGLAANFFYGVSFLLLSIEELHPLF